MLDYRQNVWCQEYTCELVQELQCLLQVVMLICQREGDLEKDSGKLYMHSKSVARPLVESAVKEIVMFIFIASTST